jgi:hypothetical protein
MRPIRPWTVLAWVLVVWLASGAKSPLELAIWWAPGPRVIVVVMESEETTPQQGRLYTAMRASATSGEWRIKGHEVFILDKDQRTADEKPARWLVQWPQWQQHQLPVLMIGTAAGRLLYSGPLPESISEVQRVVAQYGG